MATEKPDYDMTEQELADKRDKIRARLLAERVAADKRAEPVLDKFKRVWAGVPASEGKPK